MAHSKGSHAEYTIVALIMIYAFFVCAQVAGGSAAGSEPAAQHDQVGRPVEVPDYHQYQRLHPGGHRRPQKWVFSFSPSWASLWTDKKNEEFVQRPPEKKVISISRRETHVFSLVVKRTQFEFWLSSIVKLGLIFVISVQ